MQNVITVVTNPDQQILDDRIINKIFISIEKFDGLVSNIAWLAKDEACDIFFDKTDLNKLRKYLEEKFSEMPVDFIVQTNENRKKKMLISDMDSTIIKQECIDEIADKLNLKEKVAAITERAMNGELDFQSSLKERVALLEGLNESELQSVYDEKIELMEGAKDLVKTMSNEKAYCMLVSGGFTFFTHKISERLGFNENRANILEIKDGKLTGKAIEPILDQQSKLEALNEMSKKLGITQSDIIAVGDGANDLPMLKNAGLGIAYHAKKSVQEQVLHKVNHTGLKTLLYAQGYKI